MGLTAEEAIGISKKYTNDSLEGVGALKGKNATIKSIEDIEGGHKVTFAWTSDSGVESTSVMNVMDGEQGPKGDTGETGETGETGPEGAKGETGNGIVSIEKTGTSGLVDTYTITFTDGTTTTYQVTNGSAGDNISARSVLYNNAESSLESTNIQDAIDELDNMIGAGGVGEEGEGTGAELFNLYEDIQECNANVAFGDYSHAEGMGTVANGIASHAEGFHTTANTNYSHTEGQGTTASGINSHAEGGGSTANGQNAHAEGNNTQANGNNSHAEGNGSRAIGLHSHAEGSGNVAAAWGAHAEGDSNTSSGENSHTEGSGNTASGNNSHAGGYDSIADTNNSFVHGLGLRTGSNASNEVIIGKYNDTSGGGTELFKIGNGTDNNNRSNIVVVDENAMYVNGRVNAPNLVDLNNKDTLTANRQLSNIENTTITDVKYFSESIEQSVKGRYNTFYQAGSTYIVFTKEGNISYVNISTDLKNWNKQVANLPQGAIYCFCYMTVNNVTTYTMFVEDVTNPNYYNIFYSNDLTTWTKANMLPNTGSEYVDGYNMGPQISPFMYTKNNKIYLAGEIWYYNEQTDAVGIISSTNGADWAVESSNILEVITDTFTPLVYEDGSIIRNYKYYTENGTTWNTLSMNIPAGCSLTRITKYNNEYYVTFFKYSTEETILYKSDDLITLTELFSTAYLYAQCGIVGKYSIHSIKTDGAIHMLSDGTVVIPYVFNLEGSMSTVIYGVAVVTDLTDAYHNCYWDEFGTSNAFQSVSSLPYLQMLYTDTSQFCKPITDLCLKTTPFEIETNPSEHEYSYYRLLKSSPFTNEVNKAIKELDIDSGSGTSDYADLSNKPSINGVELVGNKTSADLHITGGASSADDVTYDNTNSGLSATNVQDAIDEVESERVSITENTNDYSVIDGKSGDGFLLKKGAENGTISLYSSAVSQQGVILKEERTQQNLPPLASVQYVQSSFQPSISADTTDITPGTTPLATGNIYVVYE